MGAVIIPATGQGDVTPSVACDTVNGEAVQRVKVMHGAADTATPATTTTPLPVSARQPLTPAAPTTKALAGGAASAQAVAANANRSGLIITNLSASVVHLGLAQAAVAGSGIALAQYGTWCMDAYSFMTGAIEALAAVDSTLAIQEFTA